MFFGLDSSPMPRKKREDYEGAWHHVMHRGARRAPIFKLPDDCYGFLTLLDEIVDRFGLEIHAYSLMPNHYHLLIRSVMGNLSKGMQFLNGTYTLWLNKRHQWDGPVFRGRYKSQLVEDEEYLRYLLAYIHLNPLDANLVRRLSDEGWTSHRVYIGKDPRPKWLTIKTFVHMLGGKDKLHRFVLSVRRGSIEYPDDFDEKTGLFKIKGIDGAANYLPKNKKRTMTSHHRLRDADDVLEEVFRLCKTDLTELRRAQMGPRANPKRRFAIWALNRSSVLSQREIAKLLNGSLHQVSRLLSRMRHSKPLEPVGKWIDEWTGKEG